MTEPLSPLNAGFLPYGVYVISNCLIVALAYRATHSRSKIRATIRGRGPNGLFPHFYVILDGGQRVEFRSIHRPLSWFRQLLFRGRMIYTPCGMI